MAGISFEQSKDGPINHFNWRFQTLRRVHDQDVADILSRQDDASLKTYIDFQDAQLNETYNAVTKEMSTLATESTNLLMGPDSTFTFSERFRRVVLSLNYLMVEYLDQRKEIAELKKRNLGLVDALVKQNFMTEKTNPGFGMPQTNFRQVQVGFR